MQLLCQPVDGDTVLLSCIAQAAKNCQMITIFHEAENLLFDCLKMSTVGSYRFMNDST